MLSKDKLVQNMADLIIMDEYSQRYPLIGFVFSIIMVIFGLIGMFS